MVIFNRYVTLFPDKIMCHHLHSRGEAAREMSTQGNILEYMHKHLAVSFCFETVSLCFGKQLLLSLFLALVTILLHPFCLFGCVGWV